MAIVAEETLNTEQYSVKSDGVTRVVQEYIIRETTGVYITAEKIRAANVLPAGYAVYGDTNAVLDTTEIRPEPKNRSVWRAKLTYVTRNVDFNNFTSNPVAQPALITYDTMATRYALEKYYNTGDSQGEPSKAILNSAGDPFDPPLMDEEYNLVIQIEKNYSNFDPRNLGEYPNTINKNQITVAGITMAPGQGWMRPIKHRTLYKEDGTAYDRIRYSIAYTERSTGWDARVLQAGFNAKFDGDVREITYDDVNDGTYDATTSKRVSQPRLLDTDGTLLADGQDPVFATFKIKFAKSWSPLNLPSRKDGKQ